MSVKVMRVEKGSPAEKCKISAGDTLVSVNGNEIFDVLDYRFYQNDKKLIIEFIRADGKHKRKRVKKEESEELGLEFETYLMDKKHSCKNKCVFCFIDQLPSGMRESLYFKDDDSRLSFLFGNYITLTNLSEHEIERIIKMHISPINISVHTTNPELRVKMMKNPSAGRVLEIIDRFNNAGIAMNCQLVLCPGYNDGAELRRTLSDLTEKENIECIAAVPVGLTKFREKLEPLRPFDEKTAGEVISIMDEFGERCTKKYGERRVYPADEFYLLAKKEIPNAEFYGDFLQLENGVGLSSLFEKEVTEAIEFTEFQSKKRKVTIATGVLAYPLIERLSAAVCKKWKNIECNTQKIVNNFFGEKITVAGLVTGRDLIEQLKNKDLGETLLIPSSMLRAENDMFLDDVTVEQLEKELNIKVTAVNNCGEDFVNAIIGKEE
ncbi:MAG: DUF512 domain-containing protein [Clostridiales bacterium]|nr:DUF512 domain-containing protein [Candidatus Equinaster intestinalis]